MKHKNDQWRVWNEMASYGEVLYKRASGEAPEMESSKAAARRLSGILQPGARLLDVGCGAGHYLRSLRNAYPFPFSYTGVDATKNYLDLAKRAFSADPDAAFVHGEIENLPVEDQSFDVVICMNVLLHLPRIVPAIRELWRVTKGTLLIRTLVGQTGFRIQQVREWETAEQRQESGSDDPLFDEDGEPRRFHYFNIYSEAYIQWIASTLSGVSGFQLTPDADFNPDALSATHWPDADKPRDLTRVLGGQQVNGSILEPWTFIRFDRLKAAPG